MCYALNETPPDVETYRHLREVSGLSEMSQEAAERGLPNTVYGVHIVDQNGRAIAMGRIIGDRGCFLQVVDIAVHPDHQKRGLGRRIMQALCAYLDANADPTCFVSLFADVDFLYHKFGFVAAAPRMIGMYRPHESPDAPSVPPSAADDTH